MDPAVRAARARGREQLHAAAAGDRDAAAALYLDQAGRVCAALARVQRWSDAERGDLVQSVFVALLRSGARFRGECSLATWVTRLAHRMGLNALRSQRRKRAVFSPDEVPDVASPSTLDAETTRSLRRALGLLAPAKAEAVLLHDVVGYDLAEIALLSGASVSAIQSRVVRGRSELRTLLGSVPSPVR